MHPRWLVTRRLATALALIIVAFSTTASSQSTDCTVKVTLLQVNDVYQFTPVDQNTKGGLGPRADAAQKQSSKKPKHALFARRRHDLAIRRVDHLQRRANDRGLERDRLDYATFGNHEFDFGPDVLKERMQESKFGWIAANVIDTIDRETLWRRAAVLSFASLAA